MLFDAQHPAAVALARQAHLDAHVRVRHAPQAATVPSPTDGSSCGESYGHLTRKAPLIQVHTQADAG